jgi:mannitol-1-phosphate/altronate dehydrogenase
MNREGRSAARRRGERGQVIAFLVVMTAGFMAIAGLVDDGGRALSGRERALDEAQAAARAGAQQINLTLLHESGAIELDAPSAVQAANKYLSTVGDAGVVTVSGNSVHVTVSIKVPTQILGAFGVKTLTVSADGEAAAEQETRP